MRSRIYSSILLLITVIYSCKNQEVKVDEKYDLSPIEIEKQRVELGRRLFFDTRLSSDNSISCASCHLPELAFTDGKSLSEGVNGHLSMRNAPSILNVKDFHVFMYDAHITNLEEQALVPIHDTNEMNSSFKQIINKLKNDDYYNSNAKKLFNRNFDEWVITRSLSAFEKTLVSNNSRFDQFLNGNESALNESEKAGWKLFSESFNCIKCHQLPHFTNELAENNGLYKLYDIDKGRFRIHHDSSDIGKFKVPSLRNIELTAPYMHDGSISTLDEVINHYREGGKKHFNQSPLIQPLKINESQKNQLISFLFSLTDTSYLQKFDH